MSITKSIPNPISLWQLSAVVIAILLGAIITFLPIEWVIFILILGIIGILSLITPIATLAFVLIVAPLRTLIQTESSINLPLDIGQLAVLFFISTWVIHHIVWQKRLLHVVYSPLFIPIGIFIGITSLGAFYATSLGAWLTEWLKWVLIALLAYTLMVTCRYNRRWEWVLFALISAGFGQGLIGIYTFLGGSGADHLRIFPDRNLFRAFGSFGQPNPFGGFMGLLAPLGILLAIGYAQRGMRLWHTSLAQARQNWLMCGYYILASGVMIIALIASWSRGAWLGFGIAILAMIIVFPRKLWQGIALLGMVVIISGMLWTSGRLPASLTERIASATQELFVLTDVRGVDITPENYAVIERLAHWQAALNMGRANAWLGVGFGNYDATYNTYRLINWKFSLGHAHNYYLNVLAETGIIGLIAYLCVIISLLWTTWQARHHPDVLARSTAIGLFGSWTYLLTHSMTDNLYVNNIFIHIGVMIGILAIIHHPLRREKVFIP
jgi:O-antigen ligase